MNWDERHIIRIQWKFDANFINKMFHFNRPHMQYAFCNNSSNELKMRNTNETLWKQMHSDTTLPIALLFILSSILIMDTMNSMCHFVSFLLFVIFHTRLLQWILLSRIYPFESQKICCIELIINLIIVDFFVVLITPKATDGHTKSVN